jgi:hypothetical protein
MIIKTDNIDAKLDIITRDDGFFELYLRAKIRIDNDLVILKNHPYIIREYSKLINKATYGQYELILPSLKGNNTYEIYDDTPLKSSKKDLDEEIGLTATLLYNIQLILDKNK